MLDLALQEVAPLIGYLEIAEGVLVFQAYRVQLPTQQLPKHAHAEAYLFRLFFGIVAASLSHLLRVLDALAEVYEGIMPQKRKTDNDALSLLIDHLARQLNIPLIGEEEGELDRVSEFES